MAYITYTEFKNIIFNGAASTEFTETEFDNQVDYAQVELEGNTGVGATGWTSADAEYKLVQRALCLLTAHYVRFGQVGGSIDQGLGEPASVDKATTSNFYTEYRRLIGDINDTSMVEAMVNDPVLSVVEAD